MKDGKEMIWGEKHEQAGAEEVPDSYYVVISAEALLRGDIPSFCSMTKRV